MTASERRGINFNRFKAFYLKAMAGIWPRLSHMCRVRSTAVKEINFSLSEEGWWRLFVVITTNKLIISCTISSCAVSLIRKVVGANKRLYLSLQMWWRGLEVINVPFKKLVAMIGCDKRLSHLKGGWW